jgi:hypothetical protein
MTGPEHPAATGRLDFRTATGDEALIWFMDQATKMDDALEAAHSDHEALIAVTEFLAIVSSLTGELLRRIGPERLRP